MTKRRVIGVDFDDVLIDFCPALMDHYNKKYGTLFTKDDVLTFPLEKTWGCTKEEAINECVIFYDETEQVLPVSGAVEGISLLSKNNDLILITGRPEITRHHVEKWIQKYMPGIFKEIIFTNQFRGDKKMTKAEYCKLHGISVFVDDFIGLVPEFSKTDIKLLLMDAPWNQGEIPDGVVRVKGWEEIIKQLK